MPQRKPIYPHVYLREWRDYFRLSQTVLGEKIEGNKWTIYRMEKTGQRVTKEERDQLGAAMGIPGDKLLKPPPR